MKMTLTDVKRILRETTIKNYNKTKIRLTPVEKYQVFYNVVEDMLERGQITKAQFVRWTKVY